MVVLLSKKQSASRPWPAVAALLALLLPVATLVLVGCSKSANPAPAAGGSPQPAHPSAPSGSTAAAVDQDMVSAVSAGNSTTPIALKFRLMSRPQVGKPLQIVLEVFPASDAQIDHLHGSITPGDGLQLQSDRSFDDSDITAGVALFHEITVVPQQAGVLNITTTVVVDADVSSISRIYSIPLIATNSAP